MLKVLTTHTDTGNCVVMDVLIIFVVIILQHTCMSNNLLYTLYLQNVLCQLYPNKAGMKRTYGFI